MTKTKVVDVDEFFNFVIDNFFIWNYLISQNFVWNSHILIFKFLIVQTESDGQMIKTKVIHLNDVYNFVIDDFFI
jgi:hypothetical protein